MSAPSATSEEDRLVETIERAFDRVAGDDARIDAAHLQKALGLGSEYLAGRVLAQFDADGDGFVSRTEFLQGVQELLLGSDREKLSFAFRLHDHDGDGSIGFDELHRMIAISLAEVDVRPRESQPPDALARALMIAADTNQNGNISFSELEAVVKERPEVMRAMTRAQALWIAPSEEILPPVSGPASPTARASRWLRFVENRWQTGLWLTLLAAANVALFVWTWMSPPGGVRSGAAMQLARATGACMDLDGALILIPVLRRLLTRVRASFLGRVIPVDEMIELHRLAGHTLFALALVHSAAATAAYLEGHHASPLFLTTTLRGGTGLALLAVFAVIWVGASSWVRRSKRFELFYFTHMLYVAWLALAIAHAPGFLPWVGLPLLGLGIEMVARRARRGRQTTIQHLSPLRSGVTRVEIDRPVGFQFSPGDYVFVRIPEIARYEWHPFTISSAPERPGVITLHVRSLGNWSGALRRLAEDREARGDETPIAISVDGPYGSPSAGIFRSRYAILIGAGIGVTPFASILESLIDREEGDAPTVLEKAHFFWLNRDQHSFEWFTELLREIEERDHGDVLDLHLFMTDGRADGTAIALQMAREVTRAWGRGDAVTGLRAMTQFGAPDWKRELREIARSHAPEKVEVFFCGPPGLGSKIRRICKDIGIAFYEERF